MYMIVQRLTERKVSVNDCTEIEEMDTACKQLCRD